MDLSKQQSLNSELFSCLSNICKICNLNCSSKEQLEEHIRGKKHLKQCKKSLCDSRKQLLDVENTSSNNKSTIDKLDSEIYNILSFFTQSCQLSDVDIVNLTKQLSEYEDRIYYNRFTLHSSVNLNNEYGIHQPFQNIRLADGITNISNFECRDTWLCNHPKCLLYRALAVSLDYALFIDFCLDNFN